MTSTITVSIWHNVTRDPQGRHAGCSGFTPGDQMVRVFAYQTDPRGRGPAQIAEDAFAAFNDAPRTPRPPSWPASTGSCGWAARTPGRRGRGCS